MAANGVRQNVIACGAAKTQTQVNRRKKREVNQNTESCCQELYVYIDVDSNTEADDGMKTQQKEWVGSYYVASSTTDELVYKREGKERYLYIYRSADTVVFESRCPVGFSWGCNDDGDSVFTDFFRGSMVDPGGDMCEVRDDPDMYTVNLWFGGGLLRPQGSEDAPHSNMTSPGMFVICRDTEDIAPTNNVVESTGK